jgi:hypothetical protein
VPAGSARRQLHDHHITFRSRGGSNARSNRITICAAHHLHGIHAGVVRAAGRAPHAARVGAPALLTFLGDRICGGGAARRARRLLGRGRYGNDQQPVRLQQRRDVTP